MTSTQSKSNKNNLIRNAIFAILLAAVVFFLVLYIPAIVHDLDKGQPYTMNHLELMETVELPTVSNSVTYDFVSKKNLDNMAVILDFHKLSYSTNKLKEFYKDTHIVIYDKTNSKLLYAGTIGANLLDTPSVIVYVPIPISVVIEKNHQYIITIENLPKKNDLNPAYNSFILVIGQVKRPWL